MPYPFRNLVFEGGGVKGIAYVGALRVLEEKRILPGIRRVGGTSAGAINAVLLALGYSLAETEKVLSGLNFKNFLDDDWGVARDTKRLVKKYGWYKGDFFLEWMGKLIGRKLASPHATFNDLRAAGRPDLFLVGTNLSTGFAEVFSAEHTPRMRIADAARISMSIPLFFASVTMGARADRYVDGGVLDNYPVKLFDREKYIEAAEQPRHGRSTPYYEEINGSFVAGRQGSSRYVYNRETLGFRLDSKEEIAMFRDGAEPPVTPINDFFDYAFALVRTMMKAQDNRHLHDDDWHRTVYIDTLGVGTTDFDLKDARKRDLVRSGEENSRKYFQWYDDPANEPINRP